MPRSSDPAIREKLLAAAARMLATEGPESLSTRRLANEVGTSTMAVYTHFGSMDQLRGELRREGFARLQATIDGLPRTDDPVADLATIALSYFRAGVDDPELYRAMLIDRPPGLDHDAGTGVFDQLQVAVGRCVDAGRFHGADTTSRRTWTAEVWITCHGMVTLTQTGLLATEPIQFLLTDMIYRLAVGYGDDPETARRSIRRGSAAA